MLLLLPPSETKRPGGAGGPLDVAALALRSLAAPREEAIAALVALAERPDDMAKALKLSERQRGEIAVNAAVRTSPTTPAIDRFTGVLFDALDAGSADDQARAWLGEHALIQTALLGPVGALDPIPAFRLSASGRLPGIAPLARHWAAASSEALAGLAGPVVDLRSEAYRALAPVPHGLEQAYVRVVAETPDGAVRALNHFNKKTKGRFSRALADGRPQIAQVADLVDWARSAGFEMRPADDGELQLVASE